MTIDSDDKESEGNGCDGTGCAVLTVGFLFLCLAGTCRPVATPPDNSNTQQIQNSSKRKYQPYIPTVQEPEPSDAEPVKSDDEVALEKAQLALAAFKQSRPRPVLPTAQTRVWVDRSGAHSIRAKVIEVDAERVILETERERKVTVQRSKLADLDNRFLNEVYSIYITECAAWAHELRLHEEKVESCNALISKRNEEERKRQEPLPGDMATQSLSDFPEVQYLIDDSFPEVYAFEDASQLVKFWSQNEVPSSLTRQQQRAWSIVPVSVRTKVRVIRKMQIETTFYYEVMPMSGIHQGKRLFVIQFDLYPTL